MLCGMTQKRGGFSSFSDEFLERTGRFWQPFSPSPLSLEDAREIASTMTELFRFLAALDRKYPNQPINKGENNHGKRRPQTANRNSD